ncbi:hypothetical protein Pcinc_019453 [Petrolisthes cinctipes]|uniref:Uncharacterized protein n=1 Tax=Petrolisthes cinctipes TaxID=88211 RepID=A0AAE1KHR5_PETCI|nr:hypothetical protein Pcinc_019453 [Petrolisthes cinctipes]
MRNLGESCLAPPPPLRRRVAEPTHHLLPQPLHHPTLPRPVPSPPYHLPHITLLCPNPRLTPTHLIPTLPHHPTLIRPVSPPNLSHSTLTHPPPHQLVLLCPPPSPPVMEDLC